MMLQLSSKLRITTLLITILMLSISRINEVDAANQTLSPKSILSPVSHIQQQQQPQQWKFNQQELDGLRALQQQQLNPLMNSPFINNRMELNSNSINNQQQMPYSNPYYSIASGNPNSILHANINNHLNNLHRYQQQQPNNMQYQNPLLMPAGMLIPPSSTQLGNPYRPGLLSNLFPALRQNQDWQNLNNQHQQAAYPAASNNKSVNIQQVQQQSPLQMLVGPIANFIPNLYGNPVITQNQNLPTSQANQHQLNGNKWPVVPLVPAPPSPPPMISPQQLQQQHQGIQSTKSDKQTDDETGVKFDENEKNNNNDETEAQNNNNNDNNINNNNNEQGNDNNGQNSGGKPEDDPDIKQFQNLSKGSDSFTDLFPPGILSKSDIDEIKKQQEEQARKQEEEERRKQQQQTQSPDQSNRKK